MPSGTYIRTQDIRKKNSTSNSGSKNPWYGKQHTTETIQKIRISKLGAKNPNYGKSLSKEHREKIRTNLPANSGVKNPRYGVTLSEKEKQNLSNKTSGSKNPMFGKQHSPEAKSKMRQATLQRILRDNGVITIGKHETTLLNKQEHLDGVQILRQCHLHQLGYVVDGYCVETNTVYEVYERAHKRRTQKDAMREAEIRQHLGCWM